jgi:hypothetical protein
MLQGGGLNRRSFLSATAVTLALACAAGWLVLRRRSLAEIAESCVRAAIANDPGVLFDNCYTSDIRQVGIDRSQYIKAWQAVVAPRLARCKVIGNVEVQELSSYQAAASVRLRTSSGHETEWSITCDASSDGPGIEAFNAIRSAWYLEYLDEPGLSFTPKNIIPALLTGLSKDRRVLEQIGLMGLPSRTPGVFKLRTWDEMEARLSAKLATMPHD